MEKICVAIRVRPPTKAESQSAKGHKWRVGPHNVALYSTLGTPVNGQSYAFDHVYGTETKNTDIYNGLSKDVVMSALSGFNGTVFAYGQTSSGKTYTMRGTQSDPGIIRLAVHDVFNKIQEITCREFLIRVSYMEIYNEEINDLFVPENRRLQIHENLEKGIFVAGLREEIVDSPDQVFNLLEFGESHRHFGETNMNLYSSRSHTIFRMVIESRDTSQDAFEVYGNSDAVRVSALNLVDLAGSERIAKTGAGGVRLKEGTHINKSLMTLGTVINKLSDGSARQGGHIPYRDSKLTRILQPALGGNAKTAMICTVTPDEIHIDETRGTLQFASRAKRVTNCAQVNEILTDAALLKRQTREIEDLRMKLQGLPQSEHLEKEILNLRNELLKYELEKERLFLELQEEKKAQIDRERRLKEQEQKIENLSTLFMSSNVDDHDNDKYPKKVNRRETWCPRQLSSDLSSQDFNWKPAGKQVEDEAMDNILYSMRRDRNTALPPAFDTLVDEEAWNDSTAIDEPLPPSDFENIADEDTWMSLNKGHTTSSTVFTSSMLERIRSSGGSSVAERVSCLENDLKELQEKYEELQSSFDLKVQETTKEIRANLDRSKRQVEEVLNANVTLRTQVGAMLQRNAILTRELTLQLETQECFKLAVGDLECEVDAARLLTSSLQGILVDSFHVQAVMMQNLQDCSASSPPKRRAGSINSDVEANRLLREERALVESSVQKCREICADVDEVVQDRLSNMQVWGSTECSETGRRSQAENEQFTVLVSESRDAQTQVEFDKLSNDFVRGLRNEAPSFYCEGCLSSVISSVNRLGREQVGLCKQEHVTCDCDLIAETHSRVMSLLGESPCNIDHLSQIESVGQTSERDTPCLELPSLHDAQGHDTDSAAVSTLNACSETTPDLDTSPRQPKFNRTEPLSSIWKSFISCSHVGCSFGTLGRNCDNCTEHERGLIGKNQIPLAMSNLCGHILKLLKPDLQIDHLRDGTENGDAVQQDAVLKTRLASAKLLSTWLFQDLQSVLKHDIQCLKSHVREKGSVGLLMEGLQVVLLENATLAVGLMQATCQDEILMNELVVRLDGLKGVYNNVSSSEAGVLEVDSKSKELNQTDTPIQTVQLSAPTEQNFISIASRGATSETFSTTFPGRVMKLQGVEEMLGKLLQNSMGRLLNKEQQVMEGNTVLLVLTVGIEASSVPSDGSLQLQLSLKKVEETETLAGSGQGSVYVGTSGSSFQLSCPDLQSKPRAVVENSSRPAMPDSGGMQVTWCKSESCDQKQLDATYFDNFCKAQTIQEFLWRTSDSNIRLREQLFAKMEKIKVLEVHLAYAEMEAVELKIELEDMRGRMQICDVTYNKGSEFQTDMELEALQIQCENYKEEIRLIMEQVPTSDDDVRKERQLSELTEENISLRNCLTKVRKRLARLEAQRTKPSRTTRTQGIAEDLKGEEVTVSHSGLESGECEIRVSPRKLSDDLTRLGEQHATLLSEVEGLRQQVFLQDQQIRAQSVQTPTCAVDVCTNDNKENLNSHPIHLRPGRAALGSLEINGKNEHATVRRNPKRRQQEAGEFQSNKENLVVYR